MIGEKSGSLKGVPRGTRRLVECGHPDSRHRGLGMCLSCYEKYALRQKRPLQKQPWGSYSSATCHPDEICWDMKTGRCKKCYHRAWKLKHLYSLEQEQYDEMLSQQGGLCASCGGLLNNPVVDHDHKTGRIRGLLCQNCNQGIGKLGDDLEGVMRAAVYLGFRI